MATATKKKMGKKSLTQVNEVPLSETLQETTEKFLHAIHYEEGSSVITTALVLVFRPDGKGGVDVNALNDGLGDKYQKMMTEAALKAISGKPLFYSYE